VAKYFPESDKTIKGHGQKTKSGLRSTKTQVENESDIKDINNTTMNLTHPPTKQKESVLMIFDLSDEAPRLMYTDQKENFQRNQARETITSWC
jgi:hypothetical protein